MHDLGRQEDYLAPEPPPEQRSYQQFTVWVGIIGLLASLVGVVIAYKTYIDPKAPRTESSQAERATYIAAADRLCLVAGQELQALGPAPLDNFQLYADNTEQARNIYRSLLASWGTLIPPVEDYNRMRDILNDEMNMIGDMSETVNAARDGDRSEVNIQVDKVRDLSVKIRKAVQDYGFLYCGQLFGVATD